MKLKGIIELMPIFTICLLYYGYINLDAYYNYFGISIYNYIDSTEIFLSFFPKIVFWTTLAMLSFSGILFTLKVDEDKTEEEIKVDEAEITKEDPHIIKYIGTYCILIILIYYIIVILLQLIFKLDEYQYSMFTVFTKLVLLAFLFLFVYIHRFETFERYRLLYLAFIILYLGGLLSNFRSSEAVEIVKVKPDREIIFKYNSTIIKSDSINRFVGQTRNFIFLYRVTDSTAFIYKIESCESISIREFSKRRK